MAADLREGSELAGYRIQALVARGGMGVVYRATQHSLERDVALKLIAPELASQDAFRERFLREAKLAASLEHPHVLPVYEAGEVDGQLFLALRYVEGADLGGILARGPLSPETSRRIVGQLCSALGAAHERGLLHRDVKPENVLLLGSDGNEHAYLTDFGLAKPQAERGLTQSHELLGSLTYLSPEQIEKGQSDARSDLYSLGCLLYACLTGKPPFVKEHEAAILWAHLKEPPVLPSVARPELGDELDSVIERALAKDPADRFQSAVEFADALVADAQVQVRRTPASHAPSNLPRPASSFVGRERELGELVALLAEPDTRLLTLTGPGGTGKTRLALQAATNSLATFPDGVFWIGLSALRDPALVTQTIAQTVGSPNGLAEHIGDRRQLLLLDNLEQVIEAAPELSTLLSSCPNLDLLVTSRELLRIQGELEYPVAPLAEPEAVSLFCERAHVEPSEAVAELCARLDNLPLAVELAAARVKALSPAQILERISQRLDLLKGGRDADPRQQTLRATIEWSYGLLAQEEQQLFARLSVFAGGSTLEAAEQVADADLDTLQSLVEKSLLRHTADRFWMLETIKEFAADHVEGFGTTAELRAGHAEFYMGAAEAIAPGLRGVDQIRVFAAVEADLANYRAALAELAASGENVSLLRLATALADFWWQRGHPREGLDWSLRALALNPEETPLRAEALRTATELCLSSGDVRARELAEESIALSRSLGLDLLLARCLNNLGSIESEARNYERAIVLYEESAKIRREESDWTGLARSLGNLALVEMRTGNLGRARELLEECLDFPESPFDTAIGHMNIGELALKMGDLEDATRSFGEGLGTFVELQAHQQSAMALVSLARVAIQAGDHARACSLLAAAAGLEESVDPIVDPDSIADREEALASVERSLTRFDFEQAWNLGRAMSLDEAVTFASEAPSPGHAQDGPDASRLPVPVSSFVGRGRELRDVRSRLEAGARLVTLTGPGGTGKTRLALEAATSLAREYESGVFWVGLAALRDPALVTEAIAQTLGAKGDLAEHIGGREMLLLLDNLEHVIEAAPDLVSLLSSCPKLTLLVTSRELLRVAGEVEYSVPPLAEPEAVALFCARSQLGPSQETAELCARLDSLPLAVELAAARTTALSPAQILERLSQRLDLLRGGRDADPRQQTLRATIEWSYDLLSAAEQELFARLSVFQGGCTLEAAEEVADADVDTLQSLVEKSLLRFTADRFWMLETIREYAGERLDDAETQRRYADHFAGFVSRLGDNHASLTADAAVMERLDVETANIRAVLRLLLDQRDGERALQVTAALAPYWLARGHLHEGLTWVEETLTLDRAPEDVLRGRALSGATDLSWAMGDLVRARTYATESLALAERIGEPRAIAQALHDLAEVVTEERDFEHAKELYEEAIRRAREVDYPAAGSLGNLALIAFAEGDYERSRELTLRAIGIFRERNNQLGYATGLLNLACVALYCGDVDEARSSLRGSIEICAALRYGALSASCLQACAAILAHTKRVREAVSVLGASERLLEEMGSRLEATEQQMHDETKALIRVALDDQEIALAWQAGRELALDQALSFAVACLD